MNDIQVARFSSILHKLLGITEGSPAPTLAPELLATVALEVDRPEWAFLAGERWCLGTGDQAATALNYSHVGLFNPAGSGVLGVLEKLIVTDFSGGVIAAAAGQLGAFSGGGITQTNSGFLDRRLPGGLATTLAVQKKVHTAGLITFELFSVAISASTTAVIPFPVMLDPGSGFVVRTLALEKRLTVNFLWRERAFEPSETR